MSHDQTKILMGGTRSSYKSITTLRTLATIAAGLCVFSKSDGTYNAAGDGTPHAISAGRDLSDIKATAIVHVGLEVPVQLEAGFTPVIGTQVFILKSSGKAAAEDTVGTTTVGLNATYMPAYVGASTAKLSGLPEDGSAAIDVALIDLKGGV
ncbi:hypothetical protein MAC3UK_0016 [Bdellovibrio phage MAC3UK]|nr:hypothetical protein MAC3UK_0016 [Bdellovibrio phage MAC3UK]